MDYRELAEQIAMPAWADVNSRYWRHRIYELWLCGEFYDHLDQPFHRETDGHGRAKKMYERRPSINLNIPILGADITSRKLFAGKHAPHFLHNKEKVVQAVKWLVRKARLNLTMLGAAFWGQTGSVGLTFKIVRGKPIATVWPARFCFPEFNDAEELERLVLAYVVHGAALLALQMSTDCDGKPVEADQKYWYVRCYDTKTITTLRPIPEKSWNPQTETVNNLPIDENFSLMHGLDFTPAVFLQNMPGGQGPDGRCTFSAALPNCVHLDYTLSQLGRGINYSAQPRLSVKGRILNFDSATGGARTLDPNAILQLAPDKKTADGTAVTGSDAKFLEVTGNIIDVAMEHWVGKIKQFTLELMSMNRKDPSTIDGAMSGKAMELIDEEFLDLVEVLKTTYGDDGYVQVLSVMGRMCIRAKLPAFRGVGEEDFEYIEPKWPKMYTASPQEIDYLAKALNVAVEKAEIKPTAPNKEGKGGAPGTPATGWMKLEDVKNLWESAIDYRTLSRDLMVADDDPGKSSPDIAPSETDLGNVPGI